MNHLIALFVLASASLASPVADAQRYNRALPDDNLAYPVLITFKNGLSSGSGFYVATDAAMYFVTAKHVLFNPATDKLFDMKCDLVSYSKDLSDPAPNVALVDFAALGSENIRAHSSEDVAVVKVYSLSTAPDGRKRFTTLPGVTLTEATKLGIVSVGLEGIMTFDQVLIGNEVIVMGYPTSIGLKEMQQIDSHRPLLRKGLVAGKNAQRHSIVLDCPSYPGNSGSPVIEVDAEGLTRHFNSIGVVSQYVPYADGGKTFVIMANSGYSIATPMDSVLELIK